jgi:MoaA/NifB/PqqE/SkfB family radical SAM enzyme
MGGEPLLRPDLIQRITYDAAKKDFWIYLPTNARLLRIDVIEKLADAGISTFNIAVDAVDIKQGCRRRWRRSGNNPTTWFVNNTDTGLNINIRRNNLDDVRQLTEIAHDCGSVTDDHINESPLLEQDEHSSTQTKSVTYIEDGWPAVEETN